MSFYYFYHFFQNELLVSYHYYTEILPCTTYRMAYQIDNAKLSNKVVTFISDFEVKPLGKSTSIHIVLQDQIIRSLPCLYKNLFTL